MRSVYERPARVAKSLFNTWVNLGLQYSINLKIRLLGGPSSEAGESKSMFKKCPIQA